jgi:hypothetical protein
MTIDWKIENLECKVLENGLTNVVSKIQCICKVTDIINNKSYVSTKRILLSISPPNLSNFTEFEELTKLQVVGWIEDTLGEDLTPLTTELSDKNYLQSNPIHITLNPPFNY